VKSARVRGAHVLAPLLVLRVRETAVAAEDRAQARAYFLGRERGSNGEPVAEYGPKPP